MAFVSEERTGEIVTIAALANKGNNKNNKRVTNNKDNFLPSIKF